MSDQADKKTTEIVKAAAGVVKEQASPLVVRSKVKAESDYHKYRETLRFDFYYSCAYCTISEAEGAGIGFEIDHYEPQSASGAVADYSNLMYACRVCNGRKTSVVVPSSARADGYKIFRPDEELFDDHFELKYAKLKEKTKIGKLTIAVADLNRESLKKLREIRERLYASHDLVTKGLRALAGVRIDQLPVRYRSNAQKAIADATEVGGDLTLTIDTILREHLKSPLIDPDPETASRLASRRELLSDLSSLYAGTWIGESTPTSKPKKKNTKAKR
jgi:5-methylcytosine-specific restriction endonuclease McrA